MESANIKTVVEGEASESDEEDEVDPVTVTQAQEDAPAAPVKTAGVIVSGEASESEDEIDTTATTLPPLNVNKDEQGDHAEPLSDDQPHAPLPRHVEQKTKYNSLLHRKLRERNVALRRHIVDTVHQTYTMTARDLHNITVQLQKTQIGFQDMTSHMQKATNSLFTLEDKVDIVQSCSLLPTINLPQNNTQAAST